MTHTFRHPKHYKEMRAKRRKLQAASEGSEDLPSDKPQAYQINYDDFCKGDEEASEDLQATRAPQGQESHKRQAPSCKRQAPSNKLQASSRKRQAP